MSYSFALPRAFSIRIRTSAFLPPGCTRLALSAVLLSTFGTAAAFATTYQVGPSRTYKTAQEVAPLLSPGDVVEVDGNATYPGDLVFRRPGSATSPITIRGVRVGGRRPVISGGENTVHFRTDTIGEGADHYVMEGFEITGGSFRCVFHQASDLTLRDLLVRDCPGHGILGADWGSGSLTVERTEVARTGSGDRYHQIYASADEDNYPDSVFRLQHSWIHDPSGGANVKSRAARNEIYYNRIEGSTTHELELIGSECCAESAAREDGDVVGNLLIKKASNAGAWITRLGGDGTGQSWGRYRFVNNTIIAGTGAVFRLFDGIESLEAHNNVFYRSGGAVNLVRTAEATWSNGQQIVGSNNWMMNGTTNVTGAWTGTVSGADPGFTNAAGGDYTPTSSSPLLDAGTQTPSEPAGFPFPNPLFPPAFQPPGVPAGVGAPIPRPDDGRLDLGAFERGSAGSALQLSIADTSVTEGSSGSTTAAFTVTLSQASTQTVTVSYATSTGTATAADFTAASGTLTFTAGQTTRTVNVAVSGDTIDEANETFYVTLTNPTNAQLADDTATGTIVDDDTAGGSLSIGDVSLAEGNAGTKNAVLAVRLSAPVAQPVSVSYTTANNTATAGSDYTAASGSLTIPAGSTSGTVSIAVIGDAAVEPDETFYVDLSGAAGATIADGRGQATIVNDDTSGGGGGTPRPVTWTSAVGVAVDGNNLRKNTRSGWGNSGAISTQRLATGDGFVQVTASETYTDRMFGLGVGNANASYTDLEFGLYLNDQTLQVYESGTLRGSFGTYATGDVLQVSRVAGVVRYKRNGTTFYTSTVASTSPLVVDTALNSRRSTLRAVLVGGNWQ